MIHNDSELSSVQEFSEKKLSLTFMTTFKQKLEYLRA